VTEIFHFQALDGALKQVKALSPEASAMFFSVDSETNKIVCLSAVPKVSIMLLVSASYQTL
jgi:hypothetical protein